MADFQWTPEKEAAAQDLAFAQLTVQKIADKAGISYQALWKWRQHPEFQARIEGYLADIRQTVRSQGIGILESRVRRLDNYWRRMQRVADERAIDPTMEGIPGGDTGLLVRKMKMLGSGDSATMVEEYEFDAALVKEMREHEKQAAQELGQWTERSSIEEIRKSYDVANSPETL